MTPHDLVPALLSPSFPQSQLTLMTSTGPHIGSQTHLASPRPCGPSRVLFLLPRMNLIQISAPITCSQRGLPGPNPPTKRGAVPLQPFSLLYFVPWYLFVVRSELLSYTDVGHVTCSGQWNVWAVSSLHLMIHCVVLLISFESFDLCCKTSTALGAY